MLLGGQGLSRGYGGTKGVDISHSSLNVQTPCSLCMLVLVMSLVSTQLSLRRSKKNIIDHGVRENIFEQVDFLQISSRYSGAI